jgi:Flp pilus assembly protein TadD
MRDTLFFSVLLGDSRGYDIWAQQIAAGDWMGRDVFYQAPLYPYFLGVVYSLFGRDLMVLRLVQAVLGAVACVALADAVKRLVSPRAGLIAGVMLALYPPAIFFDALVQKSVLDVLFICLALAIIARIVADGDTPGRWLTLGAVLGALALTRENAVVLAAIVVVWALTRQRREALVVVAGLAMVLLPVALRNYNVGGGFYLTTSQFGSNLYIGNNPRADGSYMSLREGRGSPEYERVDATELAQAARGRALTPAEVSRYWTEQTWAYISARPDEWLRLLARKAWLLVSSTEIIDTESQESHAEHSVALRLVGAVWHFGVLFPLAVIGAIVLWPDRPRLWPVYALTAAYAISVIAFYVVARYRLPLVPFLVVFASAGVGALARARLGWALALTAAVVSNWPVHSAASQQAITENNLGTALQETGRLDEAIAHYRRALELRPDYTPAMNNLGTALRAAGQSGEAVATYDAAIASGGTNASLYLNRGNALMQQGRADEAVLSFRAARAADPQSTHATRALANALYDTGTAAIEAGNAAGAEAALREAIALRSDYAEAHNNLGIALATQGRIREAVVEWEAALRIDPSLEDARRNLTIARAQK